MFGVKKNKEKIKVYSINTLQRKRANMDFSNFIIYKDSVLKWISIIIGILYSLAIYTKFYYLNDFVNSGWICIMIFFIIQVLLLLTSVFFNKIRLNTKFDLIAIEKEIKNKFKMTIEKNFEINDKNELLSELKKKRELLENKKILFLDTVKSFFAIFPITVIVLNILNKDSSSEDKIIILFSTFIVIFIVLSLFHFLFREIFLSSHRIEIEQLNDIQEYLEEKDEVTKKISKTKNKLIRWINNELKKSERYKHIENIIDKEKLNIEDEIKEYLQNNSKHTVVKELKEYFNGNKNLIKELKKIKSSQDEVFDYEDFKKYISEDKLKKDYLIKKIKKININLEFDFENIYVIKEYSGKLLIIISEKVTKTLNNKKEIIEEKEISILNKDNNEYKLESHKKNYKDILISLSIILGAIIIIIVTLLCIPNYKDDYTEYIFNNQSGENINVKLDSKKINFGEKIKLKKGKHSFSINEDEKCNKIFDSSLKGGEINVIKDDCFYKKEMEPYQEEHKYLLFNLTKDDIDLNIEGKYYYLEKDYSMMIKLKKGNYSFKINDNSKEEWKELCNWNIEYNSKGGLIKILENNDKTIYLKKNDNQKTINNNNQELSKKCEIINF